GAERGRGPRRRRLPLHAPLRTPMEPNARRAPHPAEPSAKALKQAAEPAEAAIRSSPSGKVVYDAVLVEGEEELARSSAALFWSGLAAGLSMGFSLVTAGLLHASLPDAPWRPLVTAFGY